MLMGILMGSEDEDFYTSAASRFARLEKQLSDNEKQEFKEKTGKTIHQVTHDLLDAFNPDAIEDKIESLLEEGGHRSDSEDDREVLRNQAQQDLLNQASSTFTGEIIEYIYIDNVRKVHEQIIDRVNVDVVTYAGWDKEQRKQAEDLVAGFKEFLEEHKDEITALSIFYNQPHRRREVTYRMIRELLDLLKREKPQLAPLNVWQAWQAVEKVNGDSPKNELVALVSLIRRVTELDEMLTPYDATVNKNFQEWVFGKQAGKLKFSEEQMEWLRMIKDHIATSVHFSREDLNMAPFDANGGIGKMYRLFGDEMDRVIEELNEHLVA
jgi:type I restriction enzyme, R subunit